MQNKKRSYKDQIMNRLSYQFYLLLIIVCFFLSCSTAKKSPLENAFLWTSGKTLSWEDVNAIGIESCFTQEPINDSLFSIMKKGNTWKEYTPPTLRDDLRYLRILHCNAQGFPQMGEMIVNKTISDKVLQIFRNLYEAGYRIEKIKLMEEYDADDESAMRDNNTSCFNFRFKSNSTTELSKHGAGLAIDINTLYNPYVKAMNVDTTKLNTFNYEHSQNGIIYDIEPATAKSYAFNRSSRNDIPFKIDTCDLAYKLFVAAGFEWGGSWTTRKDYQHFEYPQ